MTLPSRVKKQPSLPLSLARQELYIRHDEGNTSQVTYPAANPPERIIVGGNVFNGGNDYRIEGLFIPSTIVFDDVVCRFRFAT